MSVESPTPETAAGIWTIDGDGMLCWRGADRFSSAYIADLLSDEDPGRISAEDVEALFASGAAPGTTAEPAQP